MGARLEVPVPPRVRRSHAERAAETQARIKAAVVESIEAVGLRGTTASEIARRAGVTWGAVQHHFGDKRGILIAVLEGSTNRFIDHLGGVEVEGRSLAERVDDFVDRAWEHFGSSHYRGTLEILLSLSGSSGSDETLRDLPRTLAEMQGPSWVRIWQRIFHDAALPPARSVALQRYTAAVLSGIASFRILEGASPHLRSLELDFLKRTLLQELRGEASGEVG
jgi:AcrR family transcriptional regulator